MDWLLLPINLPFSFMVIALFCALLLDWWLGDPDWLWRYTGHPVSWIGKIFIFFENIFNSTLLSKQPYLLILKGALSLLIVLLLVMAFSHMVVIFLHFVLHEQNVIRIMIEALLIWPFLCWKSLSQHVLRIKDGLGIGLTKARQNLSHIVGRDVSKLDQSAIVRASCESLSENYSDGIIAPILWYLAGGIYGIILYKAINTADSQWGYRNRRFLYFGRMAARLDDLANWIPARVCALILVLFNGRLNSINIWVGVCRHAKRHGSPNAGWPESALANIMGLSLGGPRCYGHEEENHQEQHKKGNDTYQWIGDGRSDLALNDLIKAHDLVKKTHLWLIFLIGLMVFIALINMINVDYIGL
ncbi:MAG: adenosylcobinamide-phosphate synthase CbiB [Pseudomonadota bacterium]